MSIHDDDELIRRARQLRPRTPPGRPRVDARTWTPERAALADVTDLLISICASLEAQRTGKRQTTKPMPRPVLAVDRIADVDRYRRHQERVRLLLPHSPPTGR